MGEIQGPCLVLLVFSRVFAEITKGESLSQGLYPQSNRLWWIQWFKAWAGYLKMAWTFHSLIAAAQQLCLQDSLHLRRPRSPEFSFLSPASMLFFILIFYIRTWQSLKAQCEETKTIFRVWYVLIYYKDRPYIMDFRSIPTMKFNIQTVPM